MRKKELIERIKLLENKLKQKEEELEWADVRDERLTKEYWYCSELLDKARNCRDNLYPKRIIHNENATVVWFGDEKVVVKLAPGETGDVYSAVAYAIAKHMYKNNTQFKKFVDWKLADKRGKK